MSLHALAVMLSSPRMPQIKGPEQTLLNDSRTINSAPKVKLVSERCMQGVLPKDINLCFLCGAAETELSDCCMTAHFS